MGNNSDDESLSRTNVQFTVSYSPRSGSELAAEMKQPLLASGEPTGSQKVERRNNSNDDYVTVEIPQVPYYSVPDNATTTALYICKEKVLKPYMHFLKVPGWRPLVTVIYPALWKRVVNVLYPILVVSVILLGYIVQFAACYSRGNPGYVFSTVVDNHTHRNSVVECYEHSISSYAIPDLLHIGVYAYCFYLFRLVKTEQLQILMEKTFLQSNSAKHKGYLSQGKLTASLRWLLWIGIMWIVFSSITETLGVASRAIEHQQTSFGSIDFTWMNLESPGGQYTLATTMLLAFLALDVVYVGVVVNYTTQCNLLIFLLRGISERVREKTLTLQHAIKEYCSTGELIRQLNSQLGIAVSALEFLFGWLTVSACLSFSDNAVFTDNTESRKLLIASAVMTIIQWMAMVLLPFVYAARLSNACGTIKKLGIEIRTRPFCYQDTSQGDLDSFLLFTSSFEPRAKLFRIPISTPYLWGTFVTSCFVVLLLAQRGVLSSGVF